ncbi:hypothetical protein HYV72_00805, partial [Candidatus Uhrbacteria bacterium]|nr:hypothetical protein [Candidatus Uhrbacteria bacterium]
DDNANIEGLMEMARAKTTGNPPKKKFNYKCSWCGKEMKIPVKLDRTRPIYCEECREKVLEMKRDGTYDARKDLIYDEALNVVGSVAELGYDGSWAKKLESAGTATTASTQHVRTATPSAEPKPIAKPAPVLAPTQASTLTRAPFVSSAPRSPSSPVSTSAATSSVTQSAPQPKDPIVSSKPATPPQKDLSLLDLKERHVREQHAREDRERERGTRKRRRTRTGEERRGSQNQRAPQQRTPSSQPQTAHNAPTRLRDERRAPASALPKADESVGTRLSKGVPVKFDDQT